ncbi:MAG: winged helix-turn-helix domain-containing protein [bacterium]|nr:winged helix-turn-helix domain-containing protein [bacterium]
MGMERRIKTSKQLERHFKGIANHRRIDILLLVRSHDGLTLENIADRLNCNFKTISEHTRRLVGAGLLNKKYKGRAVLHSLSPYGQKLVNFIKTFQYS